MPKSYMNRRQFSGMVNKYVHKIIGGGGTFKVVFTLLGEKLLELSKEDPRSTEVYFFTNAVVRVLTDFCKAFQQVGTARPLTKKQMEKIIEDIYDRLN